MHKSIASVIICIMISDCPNGLPGGRGRYDVHFATSRFKPRRRFFRVLDPERHVIHSRSVAASVRLALLDGHRSAADTQSPPPDGRGPAHQSRPEASLGIGIPDDQMNVQERQACGVALHGLRGLRKPRRGRRQ